MYRQESLITTDLSFSSPKNTKKNPHDLIDQKKRTKAATIALVSTIGLTAFKFVVGFVSGSVGVMSEAIHSLLDLVSAAVAFFTIREAGKPADEAHPFGHGKIETLSSLLESLLLIAAAIFIFIEASHHLQNPTPVLHQDLAIATIVVSLIVSFFAYKQNIKTAHDTESAAIEVNALHFLSDVVASGGVLVGLVLLKITDKPWIDPVIAIGVAIYILSISAGQVWRAIKELTDVQLPPSELTQIQLVLDRVRSQTGVAAHDLRSRKSGTTRHLDFHLEMCGLLSVNQSHQICDRIEGELLKVFPKMHVQIHVEPCQHHEPGCQKNCDDFSKIKNYESTS